MTITQTTARASWLTRSLVGEFGAVIDTPYGLARTIGAANIHGICRIRYAGGDVAQLNTRTEEYTHIPSPTGPLLYLHAEYEAWSKDRGALEVAGADRKAFDDSDDAAIDLLRQMAHAVGLMKPGDDQAKGPVCALCLATGWNFTEVAQGVRPVWCDQCRGTGRNPNRELEAAPKAG